MIRTRNERILETKKINQRKTIRKSAGLLNTSIVLASLAVPSFSALASAEEQASTSQRAIESALESTVLNDIVVSGSVDGTSSEEIATNEVSSENNESSSSESKPSIEEETPQTEVNTPTPVEPEKPVVEQPQEGASDDPQPTPEIVPKVDVETDRPFSKEEVRQQNIGEVQVPEANHREAEKIMFVKNQSTQEFIDKISNLAAEIGAEKDLYASVMIAQAILESGSGNSSLSSEPNHNLFGIKGTYENQSVSMLTLEDDGSGNYYQITGQFRQYPSYKESLEDYAKLLTGGTSYNASFYSGTWKSNTTSFKDATAFLTGKYATDTRYAEKLNQLIDTYDLTQFDNGVFEKIHTDEEVVHTIVSGDTLWDLGNTYDVTVQELMELNQLTSDLIFVNQKLVIKKAANEVAEPIAIETAVPTEEKIPEAVASISDFEQKQSGTLAFDMESTNQAQTKAQVTENYTVVEGDSLYIISQKFKVSPLEIKHWNHMENNLLYIGQNLEIKV